MRQSRLKADGANWLAVLLLWAFFAQCVSGMVIQSPTIDEQAYLMRGYVYLATGDAHFKFGHPILADALAAVPVRAFVHLDVPADDPAYADNNWPDFSERLIWKPGNNIDLIFLLGRLPIVAQAMFLAALAFRWVRQLWGRGAGLVALALLVFDPTLVAHSRLITHDVPLGVFFFAAAYALWRYLEAESASRPFGQRLAALVWAGVAFGLAQGMKFAALLLGPVFVIAVVLWPFLKGMSASHRARWLVRHLGSLLAIFVIGALTLWATYHFEMRPLPGLLTFDTLAPARSAGVWNLKFSPPIPFPGFFEDMFWETRYFGATRDFYLCGQYGSGWWYYFPLAFLIKSPLPALLLIGVSAIGLLRGSKQWPRLMALLLPAGAFATATLVSPLYIGYRYLIPVLPFLYVLAGRLATLVGSRTRRCTQWRCTQRWLLAGTLVWSAVIAVNIHPHQLAYFNELVGGPDGGWRCLTDSNIDWGQDLPALRNVIRRYNLGRIKLSYFGRAFPSYYGIDFEPLPTYYGTPEQGNPEASTFYPHDPPPGVYALSVTNLRGVGMLREKWNLYAWFRDQAPFAKAGYSIFLYRVEPKGRPVDVVLSGLLVDEIEPPTFAAFGTNDVRWRWSDAASSLVLPREPAWYVLEQGSLEAWGWKIAQPCAATNSQTCGLYPPDPSAHAAALASVEKMRAVSRVWSSPAIVPPSGQSPSSLALPVNLGDEVQFLGYESKRSGEQVLLQLAWRVSKSVIGPRAIFVHLLAPDGKVISQWDGFSVLAEGWHPDDVFIQRASLEMPKGIAPGMYWIQVGMYNPETMKRLPVIVNGAVIADRILLDAIMPK